MGVNMQRFPTVSIECVLLCCIRVRLMGAGSPTESIIRELQNELTFLFETELLNEGICILRS